MRELVALVIGFFVGVGVFYSASISVIKYQSKNIAAISVAAEICQQRLAIEQKPQPKRKRTHEQNNIDFPTLSRLH